MAILSGLARSVLRRGQLAGDLPTHQSVLRSRFRPSLYAVRLGDDETEGRVEAGMDRGLGLQPRGVGSDADVEMDPHQIQLDRRVRLAGDERLGFSGQNRTLRVKMSRFGNEVGKNSLSV